MSPPPPPPRRAQAAAIAAEIETKELRWMELAEAYPDAAS